MFLVLEEEKERKDGVPHTGKNKVIYIGPKLEGALGISKVTLQIHAVSETVTVVSKWEPRTSAYQKVIIFFKGYEWV